MQIQLPKPHAGQRQIIESSKRFNCVMCGRRTGKTALGEILSCETMIDGFPVGWFAPSYKYLTEVMRDIEGYLKPIIRTADYTEKRFELTTGGSIEFWTLENKEAGRSRKYKRIIIDEAGIVPDLLNIWQMALRPTLADLIGDAWFLGTPRGGREFQVMYEFDAQGRKGWKAFRLATATNPYIDRQELQDAKDSMPPEIFAQEFEGVPAPSGGNPFGIDAIAKAYRPVENPGPVVFWGADLARALDWTVLIGLDARGRVVKFYRWQGIEWRETIRRLIGYIGNDPALIDSTGVGDPIVEEVKRSCPNVEPFPFTSPSKQRIMLGLAAAFQGGEMVFHEPVLKSELDMFTYEYYAGGCRYTAPSGLHDDSVCALALANYGLSMRPRPFTYFGDDKSKPNIERKEGESVFDHNRRVFAMGLDDDE